MRNKKVFDKVLLKYMFVGFLNTIVGQGLVFLLINFTELGLWGSTAIGYAAGSTVGYICNKRFTFKIKAFDSHELFVYIINVAACYFLAYGIAEPFTEMILSKALLNKAENNIAAGIGLLFFVVFNYLGQRFVVFKNKEDDDDKQ